MTGVHRRADVGVVPFARVDVRLNVGRRVISNQPDGTLLYEEYEGDVRRSARTRFVFVGPFTSDGRSLYRDGSPVWRTDLWALLGGDCVACLALANGIGAVEQTLVLLKTLALVSVEQMRGDLCRVHAEALR